MQQDKKKQKFQEIIAQSNVMQEVFRTINKIADYKTTILITGESGTGKELVARAIHERSSRSGKRLIDINCGGIPENLLESELFGHARGAFTDAHRERKGLFEHADGSSMFLDELGELPLPLQVKLLRVLQEGEIRPLGDRAPVKVDVRIIAATARNLADMVNRGLFREDLYYRINVLDIDLPPLRERSEDIPLLIDHFIEKYNGLIGLNIKGVSDDCLRALCSYSWPGNVRELENIVERSMVLSEKETIEIESLPPVLLKSSEKAQSKRDGNSVMSDKENLSIKVNSKNLERYLIGKALEKTRGNKTQAADILQISLPALLYKMKEYNFSS
ncbi:MAG: sigma-54 dependent transcriptional regulator [Desulfobia sp.]